MLVNEVVGLGKKIKALETLLGKIVPCPQEWLSAPATSIRVSVSTTMEVIPCYDFKTLTQAWRKALRWTDGLDCALSVMLASITSVKSVGDQLWVKIMSPASTGKSVLCEALSVNPRYIIAKSTIRGFHSGWKGDGDDKSLISQVAGKTLITKDGDTLLQSPNLSQILSEARDVYDTTSRTHYRNEMSRDYAGIRMTWLLCGTSSLRQLDQSELGARFLDCVIMEGIDDDLEDEILWRVANRVDRAMGYEANGKPETSYEPEMAEVMRLTGGYVDYMRENATRLLGGIVTPEAALRRCTRLGKFVAYMRARPSKRQDEASEREFAARLVSQHIRLAKCLAATLNRDVVDEEIVRRVKKVAFDTARGQTLDIVRHLHVSPNGLSVGAIANNTNTTDDKTKSMLRFLRKIGVVDLNKAPAKTGALVNQTRYILTPRIKALYEEINV